MLKRWFNLPPFTRWWLFAVWPGLILAHLAVRVISFHRLAPLLGSPAPHFPWLPVLTPEQARRARLIGQTVQSASGRSPWPGNCFDQAVVARCLLGLYGIPYVLFFGVRKTPVEMSAHAWVAAGAVRVVGGRGFGRFAIVNAFCSPALHLPSGPTGPSP